MYRQVSHSTGAEIASRAPLSVYLAATVLLFLLTFSAASSVGFVPYYIDGSSPRAASAAVGDTPVESSEARGTVALADLPMLGDIDILTRGFILAPAPGEAIHEPGPLPARILIPAINLDLPVQNPETRSIAALDELLKQGPARYVDSARIGSSGNVLIFAHSSNLPVVRNAMYKAFNRIPELKEGNVITLVGDDGTKHLYSVRSVRSVNAEDTIVNVAPNQPGVLTLVTCDTLTSKSARFLLEADYIGTAN